MVLTTTATAVTAVAVAAAVGPPSSFATYYFHIRRELDDFLEKDDSQHNYQLLLLRSYRGYYDEVYGVLRRTSSLDCRYISGGGVDM